MGKRKDRLLILEAADSWLAEINEHIVPGVQTKEERKGYAKLGKKLEAALSRETQRAATKQVTRGR